MILTRRRVLTGLIAAPALVAAHNIMPIKALILPRYPDGLIGEVVGPVFVRGEHGIEEQILRLTWKTVADRHCFDFEPVTRLRFRASRRLHSAHPLLRAIT